MTSRFGKSPSEMPSHTRTNRSPASHSTVLRSGFAETACCSCGIELDFLKRASPKARLKAKSPLTRGTPPQSSTALPARSIRVRSTGWSGLWSSVSAPSLPGPLTIVPSGRPHSTRLSPMLPTRTRYFPPASEGASAMTNVPVQPLVCSVARNSVSNRRTNSRTAASSAGYPVASSSRRRRAMNCAHWSPPWPSKTPKNAQLSRMCAMWVSSMLGRQPFISATAARKAGPPKRLTTTEVTGADTAWPMAHAPSPPFLGAAPA
mmetsp:Transcript_149068/g.415456  ORF Transcript_149068/g.415456 Transcript_149068/m.415456 type:complete len:262 (-) Transcript_149068:26-811(-)